MLPTIDGPGTTTASTRPTPLSSGEGPPLLHLSSGGIPQGQGHDAARSTLLTTYKFESDNTTSSETEVRLSIQDLTYGQEQLYVTLGGTDGEVGNDDSPNKGGGVAVDGDLVYVADTERVYVYRMADLQDAASRGAIAPAAHVIDIPEDQGRASYVAVHDGKLYVGEFVNRAEATDVDVRVEGPGERFGDFLDGLNPFQDPVERAQNLGDNLSPVDADVSVDVPRMLVYDLHPDDGSVFDYDNAQPVQSFDIPYDTQGVAVTPNGLLFTRSYGSTSVEYRGVTLYDSPHELVFQAFDGSGDGVEAPGDAQRAATIDYYAEGVNVIDGQVWITYESNALAYRDKYEDNTGRAPDNASVQRIDLDGLDISPEALGYDDAD